MKYPIWRQRKLGKTIKTNVKNANLYFEGKISKKDIYIEDGEIKIVRDEVSHSFFSGVYELDAANFFAVPTFIDSGCFALGNNEEGKTIPKLNDRDYKKFGFYSFVTSLNIKDRKERLIDQKQFIKSFLNSDMNAMYLTGGLKDKAYHTSENIYKDIYMDPSCVGASVIYQDAYGNIDRRRLLKLCTQAEAASYDKTLSGLVFLYLGDMALNLDFLFDIISEHPGREKTIVPWFINRGASLLNAGIDYLNHGGYINLVAGSGYDDMSKDFIPLSDALLKIYDSRKTLDGVIVSSFCGGYLPKFDDNTMEQRGEIANLYIEIRKAIDKGLNAIEAIKVLSFNPIKAFDIESIKIEKGNQASFLIVDNNLDIKYMIIGEKVLSPDSFKNPVLFI